MLYSYEAFDKAVSEGHLSGDYEIKLVKICDLKKEFKNVTLSRIQRQEVMTEKEAMSRTRRITEWNQKFAKYHCGSLPNIDVAIRNDLGGEQHNCNGWHTCQTIWWAMGWDGKNKSWLTAAEKKALGQCYVEIHSWPCYDDEGEMAVWLSTNGMASPLKSAQMRSATLAAKNSEWGAVVTSISDGTADEELTTFASFVGANTVNRAKCSNILSKIVAKLGGEQGDKADYWFGKFGAAANANVEQGIEYVMRRQSFSTIVRSFMKWGKTLQDVAPWMMSGEWNGEKGVTANMKDCVWRATAIIAACLRNPDIAEKAFANIGNGIFDHKELAKMLKKCRTNPVKVQLTQRREIIPATAERSSSSSIYTYEGCVIAFQNFLGCIARGK